MAKLYTKRDMYLNESVGDRGINLYTRSKVGDAFRWQVDPMSLQYCELVRIK
jgi:hypothetical protein